MPAHKAVEAAERLDDRGAWAQVEVVGVGEQDAGAGGAQVGGVDGFDAALRGDGHKGGRGGVAVGRPERGGAGIAVGRLEGEEWGGFGRLLVWRHCRAFGLLPLCRYSISHMRESGVVTFLEKSNQKTFG